MPKPEPVAIAAAGVGWDARGRRAASHRNAAETSSRQNRVVRERRLDTVGLRLWGRQLDDAQFSRAFSALGALLAASKARDATAFQGWAAHIDIAAALSRLIAPRADGRRRIAWTISPVVDAKGKVDEIQQLGLDPAALADAWAAALAPLPGWDPRGAPSFEVRAANFDLASHAQIGEWLGPRGALTASVVADPDLGAGYPFEWPVRVAVVPGTGSDGLLDRLRTFAQTQHGWALDLVEFVTPGEPLERVQHPVGALVAEGSRGMARVGPQRFDAACLIALDGLDFRAATCRSVTCVASSPSRSNPWSIGVVEVPDGERDRWFVDLIRELSHDHTLDHALRLATASGPVPLVIANPREITRMSVREAAVIAVNSLERFDGDLVELPALPAGILPDGRRSLSTDRGHPAVPGPAGIRAGESRGDGRQHPEPGSLGRTKPVGQAATEPEPVEARRPPDDAARTSRDEPPDRATTAKPPLPGSRPSRPPATSRPRCADGRRRNRRRNRSWSEARSTRRRRTCSTCTSAHRDVAGSGARSRCRRMPCRRTGSGTSCRVIFDPGGRAKPMVSTIVLPPAGPAPRADSSSGRPVGAASAAGSSSSSATACCRRPSSRPTWRVMPPDPGRLAGLKVRIEATLRPGMVALDKRRAYDLAIVHNDDDEGKPRATASAGDWAATLRTVDIKDEVKVLQGLLSKAGQRPEDYQTLRSPATVDLIFALAMHGVDMRRGLFVRVARCARREGRRRPADPDPRREPECLPADRVPVRLPAADPGRHDVPERGTGAPRRALRPGEVPWSRGGATAPSRSSARSASGR